MKTKLPLTSILGFSIGLLTAFANNKLINSQDLTNIELSLFNLAHIALLIIIAIIIVLVSKIRTPLGIFILSLCTMISIPIHNVIAYNDQYNVNSFASGGIKALVISVIIALILKKK